MPPKLTKIMNHLTRIIVNILSKFWANLKREIKEIKHVWSFKSITETNKSAPSTNKTNRTSITSIKFLAYFLPAMIFTYFWRPIIFYMGVSTGSSQIGDIGIYINMLVICAYIMMITITYQRGIETGKKYLTIFPILSFIFDYIIAFIPFVPTVMNVLVVILAVYKENKPNDIVVPPNGRDEIECPLCAELILAKAIKCKHCGEHVSPN
jgi:hypothetical protein